MNSTTTSVYKFVGSFCITYFYIICTTNPNTLKGGLQ